MRLSEVHHIMEEATMNRDTYDKMILLKLKGMSKAYKEQDEIEDIHELTFEQRLALLIDAETDYKHNHKIERLIENANFVESNSANKSGSLTYITFRVALHASTPSAHAIYDLPLPVAPTIIRFSCLLIYSFVASLSI